MSTDKEPALHPLSHIGTVHYTVADLNKQVAFYSEILGFKLKSASAGAAVLGTAGRELLQLTEQRGARRARRTTGLYHTAFLVPTRRDLAHLLRRIVETRTQIDGTSNHGTHLAIYLPDPEGNGIELAWDFPRAVWPMRDGLMRFEEMPREGVDVAALLAELQRDPSPWDGLAQETRVGHVHLHVADLDAAERFYHELLGFDITLKSAEFGAVFFSAGGYHHHIGTNIWHGAGAPPPPSDATGLRHFTIALPDAAQLKRSVARLERAGVETVASEAGVLVRDPAHNGVLLRVAP